MMNELMALLLPSIISLKMQRKISKTEETIKKQVERYLIYALIINLIIYIVAIYLFKNQEIVFTTVFTIKYIIMAIVVAFILPIIEQIIRENIEIGVKVEKDEKKD